jgi:hypothetical protein
VSGILDEHEKREILRRLAELEQKVERLVGHDPARPRPTPTGWVEAFNENPGVVSYTITPGDYPAKTDPEPDGA